MVEKLKSILNRIPSFLAIRAAVFGVAWWLLPWWFFAVVGLYLYAALFFRTTPLKTPFLGLLVATYFLEPGFVPVLYVSATFLLLVGIKEFVFIDRATAYETLAIMVMGALYFIYFDSMSSWLEFSALFSATLLAVLFPLLARGFMNASGMQAGGAKWRALSGLGAFVLWQITFVLLFLPVSVFMQALIMASAVALLLEGVRQSASGYRSRHAILEEAVVFTAIVLVALSRAPWHL